MVSLNVTFIASFSNDNVPYAYAAYFRDASGGITSVKGTRLNVCDVGWRPPQTLLARKLLMETVTGSQCERTRYIKIDGNQLRFH